MAEQKFLICSLLAKIVRATAFIFSKFMVHIP